MTRLLNSRRTDLDGIKSYSASHTGLWFDKFLKAQLFKEKQSDEEAPKTTPYQVLTQQCETLSKKDASEEYEAFFNRWRIMLDEMDVKVREVKVMNSRLALGLGRASVIETGIQLHHTYGVPYIPGSSLKGVAAHYASQHLEGSWGKGGQAHNILFGSTESAGYVTFLDAYPFPNKWRLHSDIITVHHADYYQQKKDAPADWDDPNPISFLSITGTFLLALHAPDAQAWTETGYGILDMALKEVGIGAKTASGYGRMRVGSALAPFPKFEVGSVLNMNIESTKGGEVRLSFNEEVLLNAPTQQDLIIMIPASKDLNISQFNVGETVDCYVQEIIVEEEYDSCIVFCRRATKVERRARGLLR